MRKWNDRKTSQSSTNETFCHSKYSIVPSFKLVLHNTNKENNHLKISIDNLPNLGVTSELCFPNIFSDAPSITILNHGQSEGQFEILGVEWGMYFDSNNKYYFVLEKGSCSITDFNCIVETFTSNLEERCGVRPIMKVKGTLSDGGEK